MEQELHKPVMMKEVLNYLALAPGKTIVDATVGTGGHSEQIAPYISAGGRLICIDRDEESLRIAKERLAYYKDFCTFVYGNFSDLEQILEKLKIEKIDGILFDVGISSFQLDDPQRGFSFRSEGPLDMRMDRKSYISAYDLINNLTEDEISNILKVFGEERWHNRIARLLVRERERQPIVTTDQLRDIVMRAMPYKKKHTFHRIHPATRTFQAVRIAVNRELEALETALNSAINYLARDGRICVISFHSLEDRIVKLNFRKFMAENTVEVLTPKPLTPVKTEMQENPRSRSAKMRAARKI